MIMDAYITTVTENSFETRIIAREGTETELLSANGDRVSLKPVIQHAGKNFFRHLLTGLDADTAYNLAVRAGDERKLAVRTLKIPEGRKLCRFALFPDPHIAGPDTEKAFPDDRGPRLYSKAVFLHRKYIMRAAEQGAEFIILAGDIADPADRGNMGIVSELRESSPIPWYPVIGNHEIYCPGGMERFTGTLGMPDCGYYAETICGCRFVFLATAGQGSLSADSEQYRWLLYELDANGDRPVFLFSHFACLLHPCVQGLKNDGMQQLYNSGEILGILKKYPNVKAWFAGHKNIPSLVMKNGTAHFLSPQLIQAPCAYDIVDLYEGGLVRMIHEIDEQHFVWTAREQGNAVWGERSGRDSDRNCTLEW